MTEPTLTEVPAPAEEPTPQRERSTIGFPYNDLNDAIQVAVAVHSLGDRCGHDQLITPLGYTTVENGAYNRKLAAARHFGLINYSKEGVNLASLGHGVVDPTQEVRARAETFLSVPLYKKLYEEYKGKSLPSTNIGLEAVLVNYGVAAKQKDKARQVLLRSAEEAGFFFQGRDRLVMPVIPNQPPRREIPDDAGNGGQGNGGGGEGGGNYPTLIRGLLEKLPDEGGSWTSGDREQWLKAMGLILDMVYKVEPLALPSPSSADNGIQVALQNKRNR